MQIINCDQNSPEWFEHRLASIGGSSIGSVVAGGQGKMRKGLLYRFASELLTGVKAETFKFQHADRGHEYEAETWSCYTFETGLAIEHVGLVKADIPFMHYSPDALIEKNGIGEGKVRIPSVFVEAMVDGYFPTDVRRQIQWGLYICEREWCDYVQFCPEMGDAGVNPILINRIYRDEKEITFLKEGADKFITEMTNLVERLRSA